MKKLERMRSLIYVYRAERFRMAESKWSTLSSPTKSRRQTEIDWLVQERRQWKKATEDEKEVINLLQEKIQSRLATLRRAESLLKHRRKDQTRSRFYKAPSKYVKSLYTKEKSGGLSVSKANLEEHLKKSCTDHQHQEEVTLPPGMPPDNLPEHELDVSSPKWRKVDKTVEQEPCQLQVHWESSRKT